MLSPLISYDYRTVAWDLATPAPSAPDGEHWLGTDDQARDVMARLIYGFRISVLFGLTLTLFSSIIGVAAGAVQGYFGGWTDLIVPAADRNLGQHADALPAHHPGQHDHARPSGGCSGCCCCSPGSRWSGVVRAEFLRARNFDYVRAARALGVSNPVVMFRHVLPNAMVATITFLPFVLNGAITTLTGLDFLGFGLPPGSPSLGELLAQGKANLQAPWLGITAFFVDRRAAQPAGVHRRGGARRLRSAQGARGMSALLAVEDLRVDLPEPRNGCAMPCAAFPSTSSAARPWRWSAKAAPASR